MRTGLIRTTVVAAILTAALLGRVVIAQEEPLQRIAFGSCTRQMQDAPLLNTIVAVKPDLFLMLGDIVYPDINDEATALIEPWPNENTLSRIKQVYAQMAAKPEYQKLKISVPIMAVWDDHDYGINDGGSDFALKVETQNLFLDFFDEPANSVRRKTPGIYDAKIFGPKGKRVQIILLDTRYFRTPPLPDTRSAEKKKALNIAGRYAPNRDPAATVLGKVQWRWLEEQLRKPAELRLLVSSYPVIPYELGRDCWGNCPLERKRLFTLIRNTGACGVIILSGDVHFAEISKTDEGPYPLLDFTSSALAAPSTGNEHFSNSFRISKTYSDVNFGLVVVDWESRSGPLITLKAIGLDGTTAFEQQISLKELQVTDLGRLPATEPHSIQWSDLLPDFRAEDPYELLSDSQLQDLAHVARVRKLIAAEKLKANGVDAKEAAAMEARLKKDGLDVDMLLSLRDQVRRLREIQAKTVQPKLNGKAVQLAGYVVPLARSDGQVTEFFLVPTFDACSHSIPPPPNQTVFVRLSKGFALQDRRLPVQVTGRIDAKQTTNAVTRPGGQTRVAAAYVIEPAAIEIPVVKEKK